MFLLLYTQHPSSWTLSTAENWGKVSCSRALLSDLPMVLPLWRGRSWLPDWGILSFHHPFLQLSELCQKPSSLLDLNSSLHFWLPVAQFSFKKSIISPLLLHRRLFRKRHSWKDPNSWYLSRRLIIVGNMGLKNYETALALQKRDVEKIRLNATIPSRLKTTNLLKDHLFYSVSHN